MAEGSKSTKASSSQGKQVGWERGWEVDPQLRSTS